jgi:hypothetical protein
MERLVIDDPLREKLMSLDGSIELVDAAGHLIGVVQRRYDPALYPRDPGISEEEIERRLKHDARIPADEIVPRLRKLV